MNTQEHLLVCLMEECAEVQKCASKILRFGAHDHYPSKPRDNTEDLLYELIDLLAVIDMVEGLPGLLLPSARIKDKQNKVRKYMEYARNCGTLKDNPKQ